MKRSMLRQYVDACELIKETERDIAALEKRCPAILHDKVYGSNPEFPYEPRGFSISGVDDVPSNQTALLEAEYLLLQERKLKASKLKISVEKWMNTLQPRETRIIRYRYFEGLSWDKTAQKIGRGATADSIRMEIKKLL